MRTIYLGLFFVVSVIALRAQPVNDECSTAFHLPNTDSWCSEPGAYTNVNATPFTGPQPPDNNCFLGYNNEVWFTFIPQTPAIYIRVSGLVNSLGTVRSPGIGIFSGSCNSLNRIGCNISASITNQVELSVESLVIGQVYYLSVESPMATPGTFQICIEGFIPPPNPQSDCSAGVLLCDKSEFVIDTLLGIGIEDPDVSNSCVLEELSSAWYKWTCDMSGTLTFTLTPNNYLPGFESDDIDFVLYELPNGIDDCSNKVMLRCVASGANVVDGQTLPFPQWERCNGPTGLAIGDPDNTEPSGCRISSQNSFVDAINMIAGKSYALMVNNFSQSGLGFSIEWGGTGTFQGPEPGFDITAVQEFECDKTVIFDNQSSAPTDSIVKYQWAFGAGATPLTDTTTGPISVIYASFGPKKAVLTVTSSKGCVVSEIIDFYIEPCCMDTSTLDLTAIVTDQLCPDTPTGVIQGVGVNGSPAYQFSLDCVDYQPSTVFPALLPGVYTLCIQDQKGCENQIDVTVLPANNFGVEAGDTIFLQLGQSSNLNAIPSPGSPTTVVWTPDIGISDPNILNPTVQPKRTGWYVVTITNAAGCSTSDSILIIVDAYKPIYIPNVISANNDNLNDRLTVYGNAAATGVLTFQVFDRWGGLMWESPEGENILNDPSLGWDCTFKGQPVATGVYSYRVVVEFLDDIPGTYTGTVTVLR